jgi:hypothetical protein
MYRSSSRPRRAPSSFAISGQKEIFVGLFWTTVLVGNATIDLVLDWCEQFYHRTLGADEHNEIAARNCKSASVAEALWTHYREEKGHAETFLRGLKRSDVGPEIVKSRGALPCTRRLISFFKQLGKNDTLAYLACYGVLHLLRRGQTLEAVRFQFGRLCSLYPDAARRFTPCGSTRKWT